MNNPRRILHFLLYFTTFFLFILHPVHAEEKMVTAVKFDYDIIAGLWQRTDGGYLIKINDVQGDGQAKVEYFNPRPIHVAESTISTKKELIKLFVEFQDKGYEGSTYTLFYYAEKDALAGFYYQAAMDRTYEVIFLRKSD
ncbi:MAG: hypothetical protein U9R57_08795 [Thermodesulfobacteriota bacterium]|nr:hypothetical protein [Thermodesulfobacteriota bacterium]